MNSFLFQTMKDAIIISLGGSLIVPGEIDTDFLKKFKKMILKHIKKGKTFFLICGGGMTCRKYNAAAQAIAKPTHLEMDLMGIQTTKVNAHLVKILFRDYVYPEIIDNPNKKVTYSKKHKVSKFIYCSTVGVLGTIPKKTPASVTDNPNPDNYYHLTKWQAEKIVRDNHNSSMSTCILRPTITYGKGDDGFIPKLISLVSKKRFILPNKTTYIHLLSVEAFSNLIQHLVLKDSLDGRIYFVADKEPIKLSDVVDKVYSYKNGGNYPQYLQIPSTIYSIAKSLLKVLNKRQLLTSVQLISENWFYDISLTEQELGYCSVDTHESIEKAIKANLKST